MVPKRKIETGLKDIDNFTHSETLSGLNSKDKCCLWDCCLVFYAMGEAVQRSGSDLVKLKLEDPTTL